jgi:hypothetical protein
MQLPVSGFRSLASGIWKLVSGIRSPPAVDDEFCQLLAHIFKKLCIYMRLTLNSPPINTKRINGYFRKTC